MSWKVPNMWEGGECWIIGGGPSMTEQFNIPNEIVKKVLNKEESPSIYSPYLAAIHEKHVIGINMAFQLGDWIDMIFFGDGGVFLKHREEFANFPGLKVSCNPKINSPRYRNENIKYVPKDHNHTKGISFTPTRVSWNGNSGAAAISIAVQAGAKRIVLVGFDMKLNNENDQHWHSLYCSGTKKQINPKGLPFRRHLAGFEQISKDAKKLGIEILNACPDSAIQEFPKLTVKEILDMKPVKVVKPEEKPRAMIKRMAGGVMPIPYPVEKGKRFDWLIKTIKKRGYKIGAEVGCAGGKTTGMILSHCKDVHLVTVDLWGIVPDEVGGGTQYKKWDFNKIRKRFNKNTRLFKDRITVLEGISWEMADKVEDNSLDFVFIDADHEYESVIKDIQAWTPKLKDGGMLSGHDTHFEGVNQAINELIPNHIRTGVDHVWECKKEDVKC